MHSEKEPISKLNTLDYDAQDFLTEMEAAQEMSTTPLIEYRLKRERVLGGRLVIEDRAVRFRRTSVLSTFFATMVRRLLQRNARTSRLKKS